MTKKSHPIKATLWKLVGVCTKAIFMPEDSIQYLKIVRKLCWIFLLFFFFHDEQWKWVGTTTKWNFIQSIRLVLCYVATSWRNCSNNCNSRNDMKCHTNTRSIQIGHSECVPFMFLSEMLELDLTWVPSKRAVVCTIRCNRNPVWFNVTINYQMSHRFNPLRYLSSSAAFH